MARKIKKISKKSIEEISDILGIAREIRGSVQKPGETQIIRSEFQLVRNEFDVVGVELNKIQDQNVGIIRKIDENQKALAEVLNMVPKGQEGGLPGAGLSPKTEKGEPISISGLLGTLKSFVITGGLILAALSISSSPMRMIGEFVSIFSKGKLVDSLRNIFISTIKKPFTLLIDNVFTPLLPPIKLFLADFMLDLTDNMKRLTSWSKGLAGSLVRSIGIGISNLPGIKQILGFIGKTEFLGNVTGMFKSAKAGLGKAFDFGKGVVDKGISGAKSIGKTVLTKAGQVFGIEDLVKVLSAPGKMGKLAKFIMKKIPIFNLLTTSGLFASDYAGTIADGGSQRDAFIAAFPHLTAGLSGTILGAAGLGLGPLGAIGGAILGDVAGQWLGKQIAPYVFDNIVSKSDALMGAIDTIAGGAGTAINTTASSIKESVVGGVATRNSPQPTQPSSADSLREKTIRNFDRSDASSAALVEGGERKAGNNINVIQQHSTPQPPIVINKDKKQSIPTSGDNTFGNNLWNLAYGKGVL